MTTLRPPVSKVLLLLALPTSPLLPLQLPAQDWNEPNWGTGNAHVVNLAAANFKTASLEVLSVTEDYFATRINSWAIHGVSLPTGARVVRLEAFGCDDSDLATNFLSISLRDCEIGAFPKVCVTWPTEAGISTSGAPGCVTLGEDFAGPTIDNSSRLYFAEFAADTSDTAIRVQVVRLFYELQVGPAPPTATFADVPTDYWAFQHVEALAASGITAGCGGGNFCPSRRSPGLRWRCSCRRRSG